MKIQKKISTSLLYLTTISNLTLLNTTSTSATIIKNSSKSVRSLIALFNNGIPTTSNITKTPLGNDLSNVNVQSSINRFNSPNFTPTTTKIPLKNNFENISARSSIVSLSSINSNTSTNSSKETFLGINVGSIVSQFETSIKNSMKPTSPLKNPQLNAKKYSANEVLKLSDKVLNKNGFLDGFNKTTKPLPKFKSPLLSQNLDDNLKIIQERKQYLNSSLVGAMAYKGIIFEKDISQKQQKKNPYANVSPFMRSLLISSGMIYEKDNNQQ